MFIYSDQYGAEVKKKWQRFIDGGEPQPALKAANDVDGHTVVSAAGVAVGDQKHPLQMAHVSLYSGVLTPDKALGRQDLVIERDMHRDT